ncbi:hypothetical protein [Microscilla marina]|uniref:Uncharacterized protein n=1 Tax=Microscilla marina ATCC 23134 TaxID=313606 RepID=A1ZGD3_MICM2|nr:hypothetical protein [Microscilla marina]EAY30550.1 hypothetical protein M23134_03188 [Microscilla marina ATCC 23134]
MIPLVQAQTNVHWKLTNAQGKALSINKPLSIKATPDIVVVANNQQAKIKLMEITVFRGGGSIATKLYNSNTFSLEKDFQLEKGDGVLIKVKKAIDSKTQKVKEVDGQIAFTTTK